MNNKSWKRGIGWYLTAVLASVAVLTGCGNAVGQNAKKEDDGKLNVVTTLFPYYDFARQIAGDAVDLTMVVPAGMDSHSFEPTPADMIAMQEADVLVLNGDLSMNTVIARGSLMMQDGVLLKKGTYEA